jgi:mRNA interferase MazF
MVTRLGYVPEAGDIVRLRIDARPGDDAPADEAPGDAAMGCDLPSLRPALVLSLASYNDRTGMIVCCPITTRIEGAPCEVAIAGAPPSVVLADRLSSQDWRARRATRHGKITAEELAEVRARLITLIE